LGGGEVGAGASVGTDVVVGVARGTVEGVRVGTIAAIRVDVAPSIWVAVAGRGEAVGVFKDLVAIEVLDERSGTFA
jgi:hypothetical protein